MDNKLTNIISTLCYPIVLNRFILLKSCYFVTSIMVNTMYLLYIKLNQQHQN
jgi:hypothetical protein